VHLRFFNILLEHEAHFCSKCKNNHSLSRRTKSQIFS